MNRVRMRAVLPLPLALLLALPSTAVRADEEEHDGGARRGPPPAVYINECGACHAPYPASGLPTASWRTMMDTLDRHFGSDASLAPAEATVVRDWLRTNAGRHAANPAAPLRITRTAWFLHEHDELPASLRRSQVVGSAADCGGCHRGADRGVYSEHDVRLPRVSPPRSPAGAQR